MSEQLTSANDSVAFRTTVSSSNMKLLISVNSIILLNMCGGILGGDFSSVLMEDFLVLASAQLSEFKISWLER